MKRGCWLAQWVVLVGCGGPAVVSVAEEDLSSHSSRLDDVPISPTLTGADADAAVALAHEMSERCQKTRCWGEHRLTPNELQILFAAAEVETGVPAALLKAIAYGESIGEAYLDRVPRHFIELELAPGLTNRVNWTRNYLGIDAPAMFGDDTEFGSYTYGLGYMQLTAGIRAIRDALAQKTPSPVTIMGAGKAGSYEDSGPIQMDVRRAIFDPYYNIVTAAQVVRHKQRIYGSPRRPGGPLVWVTLHPSTAWEWALIGSTYQTAGGYGPEGNATYRLFKRMADPNADAAGFVRTAPQIP